ncbi:hypothetical protein O181_080334 [Austropuccinia psidii MF-1]|uniref:Uncharacterized protein n=1 Tax=Austropuccinia psidii MF-1 TaxID=1389203 RepID=A0A9Q3FKP5_9BASI|nr:hypothetical protein [Austropuccinia psidii MF-1]
MPVQHSPLAINTRSQRNPAVLTPTARAPLYHTLSVHQLSANLDKGAPMEGEAPSRRGGQDYGETEVAEALESAPEIPHSSNIALLIQPFVSQTEPSLLNMMEQTSQFMGQLTQAVTPRDNSKAPAFNTPSMKAPDYFGGTQAHKLRGFIQSCQLIF